MAFGIPSALAEGKKMQSVNETTSVNNAQILDTDGNPIIQHTYGQSTTTNSEYYLGDEDVYVNGATNGQSGASVITSSSRSSVNTDFQRVSETKLTIPVAASSNP